MSWKDFLTLNLARDFLCYLGSQKFYLSVINDIFISGFGKGQFFEGFW